MFFNNHIVPYSFFTLKNSKYRFILLYSNQSSQIFKFCFYLFDNVFLLQNLFNFFFLYPKYLVTGLNPILNLVSISTFFLNFPWKVRLRFSGLGYGLNIFDNNSIQVNSGFTKPPILSINPYVVSIKTNKKKKKVLILGFIPYLVSLFASSIRSLKPCDVYKHKGIRWRFEKLRYKQGKKTGKR